MLIQLLILFLSVFLYCFGAKYNCVTEGSKCTVSRLNVPSNDTKIQPVTNIPSTISWLVLEGNVRVLTGGFCKEFSYLNFFQANNVSMEVITNSAFKGCDKLEIIQMEYNKFIFVNKYSFKGLKNLKDLRLAGGNIPVFKVDLSDSTELNVLVFFALNINEFPAKFVRHQKNLKTLSVFSNDLYDLDVENILKYTPKLEDIYLADNNYECNRLKEIKTFLEEKNILIRKHHVNKTRDYKPMQMYGISCLPEEQWIELHFKNIKTVSYLETKIDELSKKLEISEKEAEAVGNIRKLLNVTEPIQENSNDLPNAQSVSIWAVASIVVAICLIFIGFLIAPKFCKDRNL